MELIDFFIICLVNPCFGDNFLAIATRRVLVFLSAGLLLDD